MRTTCGERVILAIRTAFYLEQASGGIQVRKQRQILRVQELVASMLEVTPPDGQKLRRDEDLNWIACIA